MKSTVPERLNVSFEIEMQVKRLAQQGKPCDAVMWLKKATGCCLLSANAWVAENVPFFGRLIGKPCPYCKKPLKTDQAQQCFECGTDWHDGNKVIQRLVKRK